ncbi:hypothetical protein BGZ57DRAFT_1011718 [Hyaloscypha finlandica]|nr:hypothetical protein BGZ57DRAFT_1011718 [Hyaloscypha finlandica]
MSANLPCYDSEFPFAWTIQQDEEDLSTLETTAPVYDIEPAITPRLTTPVSTSEESAPSSNYLPHLPSSWLLSVEPAPAAKSPYISRNLTSGGEGWRDSLPWHQRRQTADLSGLGMVYGNQGIMADRAKSFSIQRAPVDDDRLEALRKDLAQRLAKVVSMEEAAPKPTETKPNVGSEPTGRSVSALVMENGRPGSTTPRSAGGDREGTENIDTEVEMWEETLSLYGDTWGDAPYHAPPVPAAYSSRASQSTA